MKETISLASALYGFANMGLQFEQHKLMTQQTICNLYTLVSETTKLVVLYFNYVSEHYKVNY